MQTICEICHGSGWKNKLVAPLAVKEAYILIPCTECKGKGLVEQKLLPPPL